MFINGEEAKRKKVKTAHMSSRRIIIVLNDVDKIKFWA